MKLEWTPSIIKANFIQEYFKEICCLEMFPSVPVRCHSEFPKGINKPNSTKTTSALSNILKNPVFRFHFPWVLPVKRFWADRGCVLVSTVTLAINASTLGELWFPSMHWFCLVPKRWWVYAGGQRWRPAAQTGAFGSPWSANVSLRVNQTLS